MKPAPIQILIDAMEQIRDHMCDSSAGVCDQMIYQDLAEEALALYFKVCKEDEVTAAGVGESLTVTGGCSQ